ncbi:unnamed protein product [Bemisia tabaci]|uniref:DNA cross-link repair 1A protein n=1 Tax=Bemisia tabaci TaxID=7038 RepID=A0A9P0A1M9_BEMTA|nr:unnamed protein product [Bemisia tabaci]
MDSDSDNDLFVKKPPKKTVRKSKSVQGQRENSQRKKENSQKKKQRLNETKVPKGEDVNIRAPSKSPERREQELEDTIASIYCPTCQAPLHYLKISPDIHAASCAVDWSDLPECPVGASCADDSIFHFRDFAHAALAEYRSTKNFVSPRVKRLIRSKSKSKKTPASTRKISLNSQVNSGVDHEAKEKVKRKLDLGDADISSSNPNLASNSYYSFVESEKNSTRKSYSTYFSEEDDEEAQLETPCFIDQMEATKPCSSVSQSTRQKRKNPVNESCSKAAEEPILRKANSTNSCRKSLDQEINELSKSGPKSKRRKSSHTNTSSVDCDHADNLKSNISQSTAILNTKIKSLADNARLSNSNDDVKKSSTETGSDSDNSYRKIPGTLTDSQIKDFSLGSTTYSQPCSTPSLSEAPNYLLNAVHSVKVKKEIKEEPIDPEELFVGSQEHLSKVQNLCSNAVKEETISESYHSNTVPGNSYQTLNKNSDTPENLESLQSTSSFKISSKQQIKSGNLKEDPLTMDSDEGIPVLFSDEEFERCFEKYDHDPSKKTEDNFSVDESSNDSSVSRAGSFSKKQETSKNLWKQILRPKTLPANDSVPASRPQKVYSKSRVITNEKEQEEGNSIGPPQRKCPFYKRIPDTTFVVDAFSYGIIPGITSYFLSHFHSDHYIGLRKSFNKPIYCSKITASLVMMKIGVKEEFLRILNLKEPRIINGVEVTTLDANHCPGAVMFLFRLTDNRQYLHVGDFRACYEMEEEPILQKARITALFLDTTYCNPQYTFPLQKDIIQAVVQVVEKKISDCPKLLVVCGSYTIGKEKVFLGILERFNKWRLWAHTPKQRVLNILENREISSKLVSNAQEANVHVLSMGELKFQSLEKHLLNMKGAFSHVLAFKPTGWEMGKGAKFDMLNQTSSRNVTICGVPYSEHSSYNELRRFTQFISPEKVIPTVNIGNPTSRKRMMTVIDKWLQKSELNKQQKLNAFLAH